MLPQSPTVDAVTAPVAGGAVSGDAAGPVVHVIDDDRLVSTMLTAMLAGAGITARAYDSAMDFLDVAEGLGPGCIVTDLKMPGIDGIELIGRLAQLGVRRPIIVISGRGGIAAAVLAMKAGARDFIEKPLRRDALLALVRSAIEADAQMVEPDEPIEPAGPTDDLVSVLSPREQMVLTGLIAGRGNKVIAYELGISPRTVEAHRAKIMMKTGARSFSELVRRACLAGLAV